MPAYFLLINTTFFPPLSVTGYLETHSTKDPLPSSGYSVYQQPLHSIQIGRCWCKEKIHIHEQFMAPFMWEPEMFITVSR